MNQSEETSRIVKKIKNALALAKGNKNENEAQAAMLAAQRMMLKYNLTMQDIPTEEQPKKEVTKDRIRINKVEWWHLKLACVIDANFRTYSYYVKGHSVGFLGLKEDVEIASEVYKFAMAAIKGHATEYLKKTRDDFFYRSRSEAIAVKNDYIRGFLDGLRRKFADQVQSESFALVLVKDALVETAHKDANWKPGKERSYQRAGDKDAYDQGFIDGKNLDKGKSAKQKGDTFVLHGGNRQ